MQRKDLVSLIISLTALGLSIFNTSWQYVVYQERLQETEFLISDPDYLFIRFYGKDWDWRANFSITLKIVTRHSLKVTVLRTYPYQFHLDAMNHHLLEYGEPAYAVITREVTKYVDPGLNAIQFEIPVRAVFRIQEHLPSDLTIRIGEIRLEIWAIDPETNETINMLEASLDVKWHE